MRTILKMMDLPTGRMFVHLCMIQQPTTLSEAKLYLKETFGEDRTDEQMLESMAYLEQSDFTNKELRPTPCGRQAFPILYANRGEQGWATKFFPPEHDLVAKSIETKSPLMQQPVRQPPSNNILRVR